MLIHHDFLILVKQLNCAKFFKKNRQLRNFFAHKMVAISAENVTLRKTSVKV